jgi:hypothetical protein
MIQKLLSGLLFLIMLTSCKKENLYDDSIFGTWTYQQVELLSDDMPKTIQFSGDFKFEASDQSILAGGTLYGEKLACIAQIPEVGGSDDNLQASSHSEKIYFTESTTDENYNFKNFYNGIYGYAVQGGLIQYAGVKMSLNKEDQMTIEITNTGASLTNSYSLISIKLSRK